MRRFRHIKTNRDFTTELLGCNAVEGIKRGNWEIPMWVIEDSCDWEEIVEKDYEILEIMHKYGAISSYIKKLDGDLKDKIIFKIKRLSVGEIFTVGDDVLSKTCYVPNKILSIELINNKIRLYPRNSFYNLEDIEKVKQPILTTEEGINLFEGDTYYFIWLSHPAFKQTTYEVYSEEVKPLDGDAIWSEHAKFFAKKESAERYIKLNKPHYSIKDIVPIVNNWALFPCIEENDILNFLAKNENTKN